MTPRVKIIALWDGPLPAWMPQFMDRVRANSDVLDFELVRLSVKAVQTICERRTGFECNKSTPYSLCDLRPAFGEMFAPRFRRYDFWGWCDLDICMGDLSHYLTKNVLEEYNVISGASYCVDGPFTILHNDRCMNELYRATDEFMHTAADPDYRNYDEKGFTDTVRRYARHLFGDWSSHDRHTPPRGCVLEDGVLRETPSQREIGYYHFPGTKQWPL